jgi:creatinine amidohydrolase
VSIHLLTALSWPAFRDLTARPTIAILPTGAIEAHGPHLPLGTDIIIAEAMARAGAERLAARGFEVLLVPALPIAPAPFAASFAGTIDAAPTATTALVNAVARSLAQHGVLAIAIANAHHDPAHVSAIRAAVEECERNAVPLIFPDLTRRKWASRLTDEFQGGACHAGRYETSVVLAVARDTVGDVTLPPNPRSLVAAIQRGDRDFSQAGGPDAYFGAPAEATAGEGREIIDRLGRIVEDAVIEVLGPDANRQSS